MNSLHQSKINNLVELYLNDLEDFGDKDEYILAESTLTEIKPTLLESKKSLSILLKEIYKSLPPEKKHILKDFIVYIKEI